MNGLLAKGKILIGSELTEDSQYYEMIKKVEWKHIKDTKLNHKRVCLWKLLYNIDKNEILCM